MRISIAIVVLSLSLFSCRSLNESKSINREFEINQINIETDTIVKSIAYLSDYLVCLQENESVIVLDTAYKRCPEIEAKINKIKIDFLYTYEDSVFLISKSKRYFLNYDFSLLPSIVNENLFGEALYSDSSYLVYSCCIGEFGGSVFFLNKQTHKTYSYMATCATQVLKYNGAYVVCNNLAHLGRGMDFLLIKDPSKLYELKEDSSKNNCNWYVGVDSLKDYWRVKPKVPITAYTGSYNSMSLITFPYGDSLYSLLCDDSSVVLAVHKNDTTLTKQVLLSNPLNYHESQVIESGGKYACLFRLTNGSPSAAYFVNGNDFGMAIVKNEKIDILSRYLPK